MWHEWETGASPKPTKEENLATFRSFLEAGLISGEDFDRIERQITSGDG
ncbi:MAG: hypothetical protein WD770_01755 [Actinomycetota bacterium]